MVQDLLFRQKGKAAQQRPRSAVHKHNPSLQACKLFYNYHQSIDTPVEVTQPSFHMKLKVLIIQQVGTVEQLGMLAPMATHHTPLQIFKQ